MYIDNKKHTTMRTTYNINKQATEIEKQIAQAIAENLTFWGDTAKGTFEVEAEANGLGFVLMVNAKVVYDVYRYFYDADIRIEYICVYDADNEEIEETDNIDMEFNAWAIGKEVETIFEE